MKSFCGILCALSGIISATGWCVDAPAAAADYELVSRYELGAPNFWDYLTYDPHQHRLYAAHINKVDVIDTLTGKPVGQVGPLHDAHGVAIASEAGKGYADSGDDGIVKVFRLSDLEVTKIIQVAKDADGMVFDPVTRTVLVTAGDSRNLSVIDVESDSLVFTVALPGKPEFLALDPQGHAYVNLGNSHSIAKVDLGSGKVVANWQLDGCEGPHGLAYDATTQRLFSGCANKVMVVVDAKDGRNLARLPIGPMSDSVVVDPARHRAFSANADGTLTVICEGDENSFSVQRTIPTFFGGRNMAIDPQTGFLFVAHGHMKLLSSIRDTANLRFGWDGLDVAVFRPND
jgi:DNA-binding beta-propeller fold protein YncE